MLAGGLSKRMVWAWACDAGASVKSWGGASVAVAVGDGAFLPGGFTAARGTKKKVGVGVKVAQTRLTGLARAGGRGRTRVGVSLQGTLVGRGVQVGTGVRVAVGRGVGVGGACRRTWGWATRRGAIGGAATGVPQGVMSRENFRRKRCLSPW